MPGVERKNKIIIMRILIAAGGTGGHIYPAVALVKKIKEKIPGVSILWIGGKKEWEREIVEREKVQFKSIDVLPFPRSFSCRIFLSFIFKLISSLIQSFGWIVVFKPHLVIGMGSFHSYPVILSGFLSGKPTIICEQNVYLSLTNKMLSPFVSRIALSFSHTRRYIPLWGKGKVIITGNPIREEIITTSKKEGISNLSLEEGRFTLFFFGGSQGSRYLNRVVVETLRLFQEDDIKEDIQFILITGDKDYSFVRRKMQGIKLKGRVFAYLTNIHYAFAASDLVISRSGATTISEITARGIPCILVPYPFATNQHQLSNALFLEKEGAAKVIVQEKLTPFLLKEEINKIIRDEELRKRMRDISKRLGKPEATQTLTGLILKLMERS